MLKKILKWVAVIVGSLIIIAIILYFYINYSVQSRINKIYTVSTQHLTIPTDSASYERGKHLAINRGCMGCHGPNLGGLEVFLPEGSPMGTLVAKNITSGKGGIHYTDEDWIRTLRHGVNPEGKSVWFMPSNEVAHLSNKDLGDLLCYVKQQPPVDNTVPQKEIKPLGRIMVFLNKFPLLPAEIIDHNATYTHEIIAEATPKYGAYLATTCTGCHAPTFKGAPAHQPGQPPIPDISSSGEVGKWSEADFVTVMHTGKTPAGKQLSDAMPYKFFKFSDMELKAIYAYLHQVK